MEHPQLRRQLFHCFIIVIVRKFLLSLSLALLTQPAPVGPHPALRSLAEEVLQCCLGISPHLGSLGALSASGWGDHRASAQRRVEGLPFPGLPPLRQPGCTSPTEQWQNQWRLVSASASYLTPVHLTFPTCGDPSLLTIKTTTYS